MSKNKAFERAKGIVFESREVRSILNGFMTQTRRYVRPQPESNNAGISGESAVVPAYKVGDILNVRETQSVRRIQDQEGENAVRVKYKADGTVRTFYVSDKEWQRLKKFDSDHQKYISPYWTTKETSRIFLLVTGVRLEKLQDITEKEAEKEGFSAGSFEIKSGPWGVEDDPEVWTAVEAFKDAWNDTLKKAEFDDFNWDKNPWVFVYTFKKITL